MVSPCPRVRVTKMRMKAVFTGRAQHARLAELWFLVLTEKHAVRFWLRTLFPQWRKELDETPAGRLRGNSA